MELTGAIAGAADDEYVLIAPMGLFDTYSVLDQMYIYVPKNQFKPGDVDIDLLRSVVYYMRSEPVGSEGVLIGLGAGVLHLEQVSDTPGGTISGWMEGEFFDFEE